MLNKKKLFWFMFVHHPWPEDQHVFLHSQRLKLSHQFASKTGIRYNVRFCKWFALHTSGLMSQSV